MTQVVNLKNGEVCDIYIGRSNCRFHYGNPFSHNPAWGIHVADRAAAVQAFDDWIRGKAWLDVDPQRRKWIVDRIPDLIGRKLGCFCVPLNCHGLVLKRLADEYGK